jgi:hypothetical protein
MSPEVAAIIHGHLPPPDIEERIETSDVRPQFAPKSGPCVMCDESVTGDPERLTQMLPWDFRTTFPEPLEEAVEAGKLHESDIEFENLRALHEEHARHALALLSDLDAVTDARRLGIDPATGAPPRNQKQKERLERLYTEEPKRLEHAFEVLVDVYAEAFGDIAADAFRKAIRAWHAGVEVISEQAPSPSPLPTAVEAGVFGVEEDGAVVRPSDEEVQEITVEVTDSLLELPDGVKREALLAKYAEDFGAKAAQELDRWTRLKSAVDNEEPIQYDAGHPWHYYHEGDGAEPMAVEAIPAGAISIDQFGVKWPKNPAKRRTLMQQMLERQRRQLADDERRYRDLIDRGVEALSQYDREIAHGGNDDLAWASAVALKFNHVAGARGRISTLEKALGVSAVSLMPHG